MAVHGVTGKQEKSKLDGVNSVLSERVPACAPVEEEKGKETKRSKNKGRQGTSAICAKRRTKPALTHWGWRKECSSRSGIEQNKEKNSRYYQKKTKGGKVVRTKSQRLCEKIWLPIEREKKKVPDAAVD